jgi:hypothetical protein
VSIDPKAASSSSLLRKKRQRLDPLDIFSTFAHGIGITAIQPAAIFRLGISVTFCQGFDQRSFNRRRIPGIL